MTKLSPKSRRRLIKYYNYFNDENSDAIRQQWSSQNNQQNRFSVIAYQLPRVLKKIEVLDVGCGLANFCEYMMDRNRKMDYTGVEINPTFFKECCERHPEAKFHLTDILDFEPKKKFDYVIASGSLSFVIQNYRKVVLEMIRKMFSLTRKKVVFNLLDKERNEGWADEREYGLHNKSEMKKFCLTLCENVKIISDYNRGYDFTVVMSK